MSSHPDNKHSFASKQKLFAICCEWVCRVYPTCFRILLTNRDEHKSPAVFRQTSAVWKNEVMSLTPMRRLHWHGRGADAGSKKLYYVIMQKYTVLAIMCERINHHHVNYLVLMCTPGLTSAVSTNRWNRLNCVLCADPVVASVLFSSPAFFLQTCDVSFQNLLVLN